MSHEGEKCPGRRRDKGDSFATAQEAWLPGGPKQEILGWFSGTGMSLPVTTYACSKCGYLESYINPDELKRSETG